MMAACVRPLALACVLAACAKSTAQPPAAAAGVGGEWPATAVLSLQLAPNERLSDAIDSYRFAGGSNAPARPPNERLPRRGLSGLPVVLSPVLVDVAASLAGVQLGASAAATPWRLELCFAVAPYGQFDPATAAVAEAWDPYRGGRRSAAQNATSSGSSSDGSSGLLLGASPQCAPLVGYPGVPLLHHLAPGTTATFSAWLQHPALPGQRSAAAHQSFEVASHVRHLRDPPHRPPAGGVAADAHGAVGAAPKLPDSSAAASAAANLDPAAGLAYEAPLPYDSELVARVAACMASKTESLPLPNRETGETPQPPPEVAGVYRTWEADNNRSGAFLGAPLRGVLSARQLAQLEALVACAQVEPRHASLGGAYDGAVQRDDFGRDPRYEPHTLVNLNPYLNAGLLADVKKRIYDAVDAAVTAGGGHTPVFLDDDENGGSSGATRAADGAGDPEEQPGAPSKPTRRRYALGFRCVEHISYPPGVGLEEHEDEDSTYTVSVLLSAAAEYDGGAFVLLGQTQVTEDFGPGDALVFDSLRAHRVTPVTAGNRKVLVVELWPFPDGAVPTRVAAPQRYPPPPQDAAATAPRSRAPPAAPQLPSPLPPAAVSEAATLAAQESPDAAAADATLAPLGVFGDRYVVLRGGLVGTGSLPFRGTLPRSLYRDDRRAPLIGLANATADEAGGAEAAAAEAAAAADVAGAAADAAAAAAAAAALASIAAGWFTWPEAVAACDLLLTCTAFAFHHPTPLLGDAAQAHVRVHVAFKREASPIRVKGAVGGGGGGGGKEGGTPAAGHGGDGCAAAAWGSACWTAVKPWPLRALLAEFARLEPGSASAAGVAGGGVALTADYRECEEWALDGHCARLPAFMQARCGFFCRGGPAFD